MKKIIAAITTIALVGGSGYFYATQRFASEAEFFKQAIEKSNIFKTQKVEVNPYQFKISIHGMEFDLTSMLPEDVKIPEGESEKILNVKQDQTVVLKYSPLTKTLEVESPDEKTVFTVNSFGKKSTFIASGDADAYIYFSTTPSFEDKTFTQFIRTYVSGMKAKNKNFDLRAEGADDAIISGEYSESSIAIVPAELGSKVDISYKVKGEQINSAALFDTIINIMPKETAGLKDVINQVKPSEFLKGLKRDRDIKYVVETDFGAIIDTITAAMNHQDDAARSAELASLVTKLKGVKLSVYGQDEMLGARLHTVMDISAPMTLPVGHLKFKMDFDGKSSKEFQEKLPDILLETYHQNLSMLPEADRKQAEADGQKFIDTFKRNAPDLMSLGNIITRVNFDGDISKYRGAFLLEMLCDLYGAKLTVDSVDDNIKMILRVTNADQLFADFEAYLTKVINDPDMADTIKPDFKQQLPMYLGLAKTTLKSMAKESKDDKGNTVLEVEQTIPASVVANMVAGAPGQSDAVPAQ